MDLSRYVDELQHQLTTAAAAAGDEARELAERLTAPLDAAVRLVLLEALSTAANEITAELAPGPSTCASRAVTRSSSSRPPRPRHSRARARRRRSPHGPRSSTRDDVSTSRTTLRLPDQLKAQVEEAAAREGVSVNTWLVRAVAAALQPAEPSSAPTRSSRTSGRLTGWVR